MTSMQNGDWRCGSKKTPQYPYAITLGALPLTESHLVYQVGKQIGLDLKSAGLHYNFTLSRY
jgi:beta-glucosidase-like glycosyl hydrolase